MYKIEIVWLLLALFSFFIFLPLTIWIVFAFLKRLGFFDTEQKQRELEGKVGVELWGMDWREKIKEMAK